MSKDITAVEWLVEQMLVCNYINKKQYDNCKTWLLQEAKEIEQQQVIDAYHKGCFNTLQYEIKSKQNLTRFSQQTKHLKNKI